MESSCGAEHKHMRHRLKPAHSVLLDHARTNKDRDNAGGHHQEKHTILGSVWFLFPADRDSIYGVAKFFGEPAAAAEGCRREHARCHERAGLHLAWIGQILPEIRLKISVVHSIVAQSWLSQKSLNDIIA